MTTEARKPIISDRLVRKFRLGSGLVIFSFVIMHLANHSLGLISLSAATEAQHWFMVVWRNPVGTVLFYGALIVHILLVLRMLYKRRTLVMPAGEAFQIVTGLLVPLLLIDHIIATRIVHEIYGYHDNYRAIVRGLWVTSPLNGVRQSIVLLIVWLHGCIGIHFWLRYRAWYTAIAPVMLSFAITLPVLALLGFAAMGKTVSHEAAQEDERGLRGGYYSDMRSLGEAGSMPGSQVSITLWPYRAGFYGAFSMSILGLFAFRTHRRLRERQHQVAIRYAGGEIVHAPRGFTVLEASRLGGIPHYSVCGGKGQCSTCRVQIIEGTDNLPPPEGLEQKTLNRIGATLDVRLACQLRPTGNISVVPLLTPMAETAIPVYSQTASPGREREIVVFFCDLRHFTALTEARLPFDIVFLLNRYFAIVGRIVEENGGRMDKFIGDGAMALFGLRTTPKEANRQALKAAAEIVREIDKLSAELADDLAAPLEIAIGLHTGSAVVGSMGYGNVKNVTAIGDTVNVASRLESVAKEFNRTLVFSEPVAGLSGVDIAGIESREIAVRGRGEPLRVYIVRKEESARFA
ncbi:2Fe-2S iron-sulfur cluster binding domain-containing protein [Agrobacterium rhizogenes]|uniref:Adenylate cyclase n=1 Tax=Rhizobium rhizogenes NBRC 13257 TaxID=1220581 RepID=A0AA87Q9E2_RHIRH|nr:adenylate/guanylate cyclase domain-containing protein [Rhizobium rhizogenes]OCJ02247.1 adenylate cyclase [Agrobacterium sp. 13-626]OCJ19569.1 adenylate cyclase [Agrobacterium sp. B133/95]KEA08724.1 adenylate cyclase [Rhizobium rhizogenes]MQB30634.1 adenylate/guanylate cyclase domain-containing protein [Rhizobium rhizogenes]NTF58886.1 2Fe-2S iron-sulfur cluster binding domain-containing protein [Rhizobium rhizogenes]